MKRITVFRILLVISILTSLLFTKSCANTRTGPEGGPKDTIPPVLVEILPVYNAVNHPTEGKHSVVSFEFNEYVALDQPGNNIFLSPPQLKGRRWLYRSMNLSILTNLILCRWVMRSKTIMKETSSLRSYIVSLQGNILIHCLFQEVCTMLRQCCR